MARLHRFLHAVASGYTVLAANVLFTLGSVPLALHYLGKEEFGLWSVVVQISGYLSLVDLGMSSSLARLLIDHKDRAEGPVYGSMVATARVVLLTQALTILFVGVACSLVLAPLLNIPAGLTTEFQWLMALQCAVLAAGFATRIFSQLLYAHHRLDISNYSQSAVFLISLAVLWICFVKGVGIYSLVWANAAGFLLMTLVSILACWKLNLLPARGKRGKPTWARFRELVAFGKDIFLISVGAQLVMATQVIIITRTMGLDAAATWTVCTRAFNLACLVCWRPLDMSFTLLSEMIVRGEQARLQRRFHAIVRLTFVISAVAAVMLTFCNQSFVAVWTTQRISWPPVNDALLGIWLILLTIVRCHSYLVQATKEIRFLRYAYFVEGLVFVVVAGLTTRRGGYTAMLWTSIACTGCFTASYGVWRTSRYFQRPISDVGLRWHRPMFITLLLFIPVGVMVWRFSRSFAPMQQLLFKSILLGVAGAYFLFAYGLTDDLKSEMHGRLPKRIQSLLGQTKN